ncbi:hypothetical protein HZS_935 [Henneguya salminicola]|nr:hypothetical protein HZS_935 [Henneguya salminicola]
MKEGKFFATKSCIKCMYLLSFFEIASGCGARLIKKGNDRTLKGSHICTQNDYNQLETTEAITNAENFTNSLKCEKSSRIELNPHQIYENLLLTLRQHFTDMV